MTYVTPGDHPSVIEYYLDLLSGVIPSHALRRLTLLSPYDDSDRPLISSCSSDPSLERIEAGILNKDRAHTHLLQYYLPRTQPRLALESRLWRDPLHLPFGTKVMPQLIRGARDQSSHCSTIEQRRRRVTALVQCTPNDRRCTGDRKTNEGVSGEGNATVDLSDLSEPQCCHRRARARNAFRNMAKLTSMSTQQSFALAGA